MKKNSITVIGGCGHVGLPLAIALADKGFDVNALDIDPKKVEAINKGKIPFIEFGAEEVLIKVLTKATFIATTDPKLISNSEVVIVVVGTPVDEHFDPDPHDIIRVLDSYKHYLQDNQLLILRSTVYPGVTRSVERWALNNSKKLKIAFCPERIAEGYAMTELYTLPQIIGARTDQVFEEAKKVFSFLTEKIIRTTPEEAELAKLFTNAWRYIKFSVANQFFMLASNFNVDFENVRNAISYEYPRASDLPKAGFAAGPCLLKDTMQLSAFSGNTFALGHSAMLINEGLPGFVVEQIEKLHDLSQLNVGILGMAFKQDIDDNRSSLSYKLRRLLSFKAKNVFCSDPYIKNESFISMEELIFNSDIVVIGTPHKEYLKLTINKPVFDIWNLSGKGLLFSDIS